MYFLGFDPGGRKQFGWCVASTTQSDRLKFIDSGIADESVSAIAAATRKIDTDAPIAGVGIDSPLYWVSEGSRRSDCVIRSAMKRLGARNSGGTIQQVNSLRGACLVQGILTAHHLRSQDSSIRITETHPKALLWLIDIANQNLPTVDVRMSHLESVISTASDSISEHERDAALGAVAAWSMVTNAQGWRDLYLDEERTFVPVSPVEYWMPIPEVSAVVNRREHASED